MRRRNNIKKEFKSKNDCFFSRRQFLKACGIAGLGVCLPLKWGSGKAFAAIPGGTLDPTLIPKYISPLVKPPVMPRSSKIRTQMAKNIDYYEIAVRQFQQQILPSPLPMTTVWSYGPFDDPRTVAQGGRYFYPAFTIEAKWRRPARVKWINDLVDANGNYLPHLLPVDQTLHWANPPGGIMERDMRGTDPTPYTGPVPIVTHLHGSVRVGDESDGYAEAWFLPNANNIPAGFATKGTWYNFFKNKASQKFGVNWAPGTATFQYPNGHRATTLWYHDHSLGMTRLNVYAGPAGFYLLRGGPDDMVLDSMTGTPAILPGPRPGLGINPFGTFYEIPIVIQDRSFDDNGSLFYPDNRAFFEVLNVPPTVPYLDIPFIPDTACDGQPSDVSPIWQPEFFGNTIVVNGQTWPFLDVEQRRYRFRFLNGCNSRFLVLQFPDPRIEVWQIGNEGGFLPAPVRLNDFPPDGALDGTAKLLMGPAERADVIVDFTNIPVGTSITLLNLGPDEPFGGFPSPASDPATTGQIMEFRVGPAMTIDTTTPPQFLQLPAITPLGLESNTQWLSLNEEESASVRVVTDGSGNVVLACDDPNAVPFGPTAALLGIFDLATGTPTKKMWADAITENPAVGATEVWEMYNFTADAHPIHIHEIHFQVVDRQALDPIINLPIGTPRPPEAWETGFKDTVIAYPGEVTRVKARFDVPGGQFVWHCHIVEHEDNEMMRPYRIGPVQIGEPA